LGKSVDTREYYEVTITIKGGKELHKKECPQWCRTEMCRESLEEEPLS